MTLLGTRRDGASVLAPGIPVRASWGGAWPPLWPLAALFVGIPVWWALGISAFIAPAIAFLLLAALMVNGRVLAPRGFGIWLLFLLWALVTATQIDGFRQWFAFGYRFSFYAAGGVVFLYVLNTPREFLASRQLVNVMALFFGVIVAAGLVGIVLPHISFPTPMQALLPGALLEDNFVRSAVRASTTARRAFAAYPIYRPTAPFAYTNQWGATFALTLPLAFAALDTIRTRRWRRVHLGFLVASVVPLVFSLGRGAWLSVAVALAYAGLRVALDRDKRGVAILLLGLLMGGALFAFSPLKDIVLVRLAHGYSDQGRLRLYTESLRLVGLSPVFGYGSTVPIPGSASAGTHGQLWTLLVSHGIPGAALFTGWLGWAFWRSGGRLPGSSGSGRIRFWCHIAILAALVQLPVYPLIPWGLPIVMVAAALAWRETLPDPALQLEPEPDRR